MTDLEKLLERGLVAQNEGRWENAREIFNQALKLDSKNGVALYSLGVIEHTQSNPEIAFDYLKRLVEHHPQFPQGWFAIGIIYGGRKMYAEAHRSYDNALQLNPTYTEVLINKGVLYEEAKQHRDSLECFEKILQLDTNHQAALCNSGILLTDFKKHDLANQRFKRLVDLNPDYDYVLGLLSFSRLSICDWTDYHELKARILAGVALDKKVCKPLAIHALTDDSVLLKKCAQRFAEGRFNKALKEGLPVTKRPDPTRSKIRLAYISPDFREHPVGQLFRDIIQHHSKDDFELIGYSLGIDDQSQIRSDIISKFDVIYDVRQQPSFVIEQAIRDQGVDILVDLAGYTADSRTEVFVGHPAPVTVNFLGFPGTLGLKCYDYIIADSIAVPEYDLEHYVEKVIWVDGGYFPIYEAATLVNIRKTTRQEHGLPDDEFIFASFCNNYKINPEIFDIWMSILRQCEHSILWLAKSNPESETNLRKEALARDVSPDRLYFADRTKLFADHLSRYTLIDLFLDTFPYTAHTTALDALSAGCPILTCQGGSFHSRGAASILSFKRLDMLITHTLQEYAAKAVALYESRELLRRVKDQVSNTLKNENSCGAKSYVQNLENAFKEMLVDERGAHF